MIKKMEFVLHFIHYIYKILWGLWKESLFRFPPFFYRPERIEWPYICEEKKNIKAKEIPSKKAVVALYMNEKNKLIPKVLIDKGSLNF